MIPRGIEILVKKASVDGEFRRYLLAERAAAATRIGLDLTTAETDILNGIPQSQLIAIIGSTRVSPRLRPAFMGYAATAIFSIPLSTFAVNTDNQENTDTEYMYYPYETDEYTDHIPGPAFVRFTQEGIRPDLPTDPSPITELNIKNGIEKQHDSVQRLYNRIIELEGEAPVGIIYIYFFLLSDGSVSNVIIDLNSTGSERLAEYLVNFILTWNFDPIEEPEVKVCYPLAFS